MSFVRIRRQASSLLAVVCVFPFTHTSADIIYVDVADIPVFGISAPAILDLDLDSNGVVDFVFQSSASLSEFFVDPQAANQVSVGGDTYATPLPSSSVISSLPEPFFFWSNSDLVGISACATFPPPDNQVCIGDFHGQTAYMGVMFDVEGAPHYGWIQIAASPLGAGGHILDYAYESTPGQGIAAGAIPEPTTCLLFLFAGFVLTVQHCRRR